MSSQAWNVLLYAAAGMGCAILSDVCYGLLRPQRRLSCFGMDVFFGLACCAVLFCVTVGVMQDNLRGYLLMAWIGAALLWERSGGRLLRKLFGRIRIGIDRLMQALSVAALRAAAVVLSKRKAIKDQRSNKINKKSKSRAKSPFLFPKNRVK